MTAASFRSNYPEFGSLSAYPASAVTYWLTLAGKLLNAPRWQDLIDVGTELFVAHNLALEAKAQAEAQNGSPPGGQVGPISNKSVDKVSVAYDVAVGVDADSSHWNLTIYGTRFINLAKMMGAGPVQVGIGCTPFGAGSAWSGPPWYNFPNPS